MDRRQHLVVAETFYSLQGESTHAGLPCFFIRLAGCNLSCAWCDTPHAGNVSQGRETSLSRLLDEAAQFPGALVEITGGEPLLQPAVYPLMRQLTEAGRTVLLETNGSVPLDQVPPEVIKIVDVKCPASGMSHTVHPGLAEQLLARADGKKDEVKFVIATENDFHWATDYARTHDLAARAHLLFSPVTHLMAPAKLAEMLLASHLEARLQLQLHTLLWPGKQGV